MFDKRGCDHSLPRPLLKRLVEDALQEDIPYGDLTTDVTIGGMDKAQAKIVAKEDLVLAGCPCVSMVFHVLDPTVQVEFSFNDGDRIGRGQSICTLKGRVKSLLEGERVALNFLQRLSGIATLTNRFVQEVKGLSVRICDTRKTTPNLRLLEKYAVRMGGGHNHRYSLSDGILIKDNHIVACGSIREAVERARANAPHPYRIEVEVETLEGVKEAIGAGADAILLDNMSVSDLRRAVAMCRDLAPQVLLEASGGVTLENVREIAETGVDLISIGALTHSAPSVDISMDLLG